ncbi:MAG TPA: bifunctional ADP-dependent NAD(P)H-hydrate dehydratase/NAD(P)H-hydrate epimerase [Methermicoccus shengliensis]|uniref:Bifunctional NAD(P)H-hydrate repair enzyme n=2 Tax=Methermicoccus shengliensis TaxID=660064 RepID=A0A832VZK3_9EURY|nr:MAG: hypothetical protein XD62_1097 [Methanosarcinales archeaon 56_1174]HIH69634.1 bifunctional ADP-dependent NAD(P)H-hydrate dehydratase/NAD(P)H-hydrate epimerase [Methermicoccus shengliensis]
MYMSSEDVRRLDENCAFFGLDTPLLMENAGAGIAREIARRFPRGRLAVFAGTGNNGGDGLVAARHLTEHEITVFLLGRSMASDAARRNLELLTLEAERGRVSIVPITDSSQLSDVSMEEFEVVVDAMLGTGAHGAPREPVRSAIELINTCHAFVVAVDIPSGLDPDTGRADVAVRADMTLTLHAPKRGFSNPDAGRYTGEVVVVPIGISPSMEQLIGPGDMHAALPSAKRGHKGQNGRVLVIGGGPYTGAPALVGLAALRAGADLVTVATPSSVSGSIASFSPDLIVRPLEGDVLCCEHLPEIEELIERHDVVVVGNGLGRDAETLDAVEELLPMCGRAVLDADALKVVHEDTLFEGDVVLTPHMGELAAIVGRKMPTDLDARCGLIRDLCTSLGVVVLSKGAVDVVSDGRRTRLNITGNGAMAVGGTGDVLAGITGALLCRTSPFEAACAAAFINGAAGDMARLEGGYSLLATDLLPRIPRVMAGEWRHYRRVE